MLKLVLLQFKKDTKEQVYVQTLIEQKVLADDIERVVPFLFRDRILSCISNFAYSKSQISVGDSQAVYEASYKWIHLEELAMLQIQRVDFEVDENIVTIEKKLEKQRNSAKDKKAVTEEQKQAKEGQVEVEKVLIENG